MYLNNDNYKIKIRDIIEQSWKESPNNTNLALRFDWLKHKIREYSIKFGKEKAKNSRKREREIVDQINTFEEMIGNDTISNEQLDEYNDLKKQLESLEDYKTKGLWIRSRLEHIESDEKSTAFFFNKAKHIYNSKSITHIILENGNETSDPNEIQYELERFYKQLYKSVLQPVASSEQTIQESDIPTKLNEDQKNASNGYLTIDECLNTLKNFKKNKTPGCDGLPAEFYLTFWPEIGNKLVSSINYSLQLGELSTSQKRGVITLQEKKGKDPKLVKNWRPVTLLNTDYKILTKTLSRRIEKALPDIIHQDQFGFIKGRYIGEPVRFVQDLINKYDEEKKEGIIMQLDFEKAFDSIEWNFIFEALKKFNFGDQFIEFVRCCYTNIQSCVQNNGFTTKWFELERGVRQGCPLSCLLFILSVERMGNRIRNRSDINGLYIGENEHKIKQFADDCSCFLNNFKSIYTLIDCIKGFTLHSGLKLNADKSILFFLGPWRTKDTNILNMQIERETINMLGIEIGRCQKTIQAKNFEDKIPKMIKQLHIHSSRNLSLCGKILLTKSIGISKFIHPMSIVDMSDETVKKIQSQLNQYIWSYKPAKVKHTVLVGDMNEAGLRSIDVKCKRKALIVNWFMRFRNGRGWQDVIREKFEKIGGLDFLLNCDYDTKYLSFLPKFYRNFLDYFQEITVNNHGENIIWNNRNILIENKTIFWKDWFNCGIIFIHQLKTNNNTWMSYDDFYHKYNVRTTYLTYFSLINTMKKALRQTHINYSSTTQLNTVNDDLHLVSGRRIKYDKAKSKDFYHEFLEFEKEPAKALNMWSETYNYDENLFYESMVLSRECTSEPSLLSNQFKILHNITNCRKNLFKWGIAINDTCEFCNDTLVDTLVHALCECNHTKRFTEELFRRLDRENIYRNNTSFIFGVNNLALNMIFLIVKKYILYVRTFKLAFSSKHVMQQIYDRIIVDKRVLSQYKFNIKWVKFINLVNEAIAYHTECC